MPPRPAPPAGGTMIPPWRRRGPRWGLTVAVLLGAGLLGMFGLFYLRSTALLFRTLDRSVAEQLELLAARPPDMLRFMIISRMNGGAAVVTRVGLFTADLVPLAGDITHAPPGLALDGRAHPLALPEEPQSHWRAAGRILPDGQRLYVARDDQEILEIRADLLRAAAFGIIPTTLLCIGCGVLVGALSERRLLRLNDAASAIIEGHIQQRLPANQDGDELDRLCMIVNCMLDRLEDGVTALSSVGENIAHDLRTPLTALRARLDRAAGMLEADDAARQAVEHCIGNVDQALGTITALLRIADIQHGVRMSGMSDLALREVVLETAESFQAVAEDKNITFAVEIAVDAHIVADRALLIEALVNLVDNAIKFTPPGGQVRLALEGTPANPILVVSDTGPGIPPGSWEAVQRRFVRLDASRTAQGSGLGLSLVSAIAALHGFALVLADCTPGCRIEMHCWPSRS